MSVGKIPFLEAVNGSTVMLPCTYASCIGIKNLYFSWQFNDNGTMQKVRALNYNSHVLGTSKWSFWMIDWWLIARWSQSGVWLSDIVRGGGASREYISGAGGVCGEKRSQQHLHLAVEHHLRGRRLLHLFWTQPQREGQEPQCHLPPHCGGRVWVVEVGEGGVWFVFIVLLLDN